MEKKESAFLSVNQRPDLISDNAYYILGRVYAEVSSNGLIKSPYALNRDSLICVY